MKPGEYVVVTRGANKGLKVVILERSLTARSKSNLAQPVWLCKTTETFTAYRGNSSYQQAGGYVLFSDDELERVSQ